MEPLAEAASVAGIASLTIQLAEGLKKLHNFCNAVQDAPEAVRNMADELKILHDLLLHIQSSSVQYQSNVVDTAVLEGCTLKVNEMMALVKKHEKGLHSSSRRIRKLRAVQVVFQQDKIMELKLSLSEAKMTLLLARQHIAE